MCSQEEFARLRDQTADNARQLQENTKQITELAKRDAEQSIQIADIAKTTEKQGDSLLRLVNRLVAAIIGILVITVLAVVFGALGEKGFNAVTRAATDISAVASREASALQDAPAANNNNNNRKGNKR